MGQSFTTQCLLTEEEVGQYVQSTVFTENEIRALWVHFKKMNANSEFMTRKQFQQAMLFTDSALLDRIFRVFDTNDDDQICFPEYISCLSAMSSKAPREQKLKFSFQIYDFDGDGFISTTDLTAIIAATLREQKILILRGDIDTIVAQTMEEARPKHPDMIAFEEYSELMKNKTSNALAHLSINISSIIEEYTKTDVVTLNTPRNFASALNLYDVRYTAPPKR